ncbi:hypothetical protein EUGRSUZ_B03809 [Eucalyptus grandis]|uniref:Uncharacterized protein n=2 Tax=Eucalyptus grandis TaxID=71139 RepID=A0ACC3LXW4_EUCGR|nr:hypothetical protein EUGRSUZ_B03809 [Eucalyptus grandis]
MADWEKLSRELLELIAQRLAIEDFLAFGAVCTSWRSVATKEMYDAKSKAPWLVTSTYKQMPELCSPSRGRIYPVKSPGTRAQTLSPRGWMLLSNWDHKYRIFNPVSSVSIELPALEKLLRTSRLHVEFDRLMQRICVCLRIDRIALSSSPSLSRSYAVMIAVNWDLGRGRLAFHRSGEDEWTVVSRPAETGPPWPKVLQLIYYDGLFVALDAENHITTLNERERRMESRLVLGQNFKGWAPYLVECSGSLLVAWKTRGGKGNRFRVFEVDLEKGTQEEVKSLGNASLFLNDNSSFSMEFNAGSCLPGIKPNHVYYVEEKKEKIYSMDYGSVETFSDATDHGRVGQWCRHERQWFQPDF